MEMPSTRVVCGIRWGGSFPRNHKICRMSRVIAYFTVRKLRARPNAHCVLRIYARNVATALVEFQVDLLDWRHISLFA